MTTVSIHRQVGAQRSTDDEHRLWALVRRATADPRGADPGELLTWLARTLTGAHAALFAPSGAVMAASSPEARSVLAPCADHALRVAEGRVQSAGLNEGPMQIRITPTSDTAPSPVLAVRLPAPWSSRASTLFADAAVGLGVLLAGRAIAEEGLRQRQAGRDQADAVFRLLMGGVPTLARSAGAHIVPAVLGADRVRVCIIDCGTEAGARGTLAEIEQKIGTHVLALVCASIPRNLNIVMPADGSRTRPALERLVAEREERCMGVSAPMSQDAVPVAYREATNALAVAPHRPERVAEINAQHSVTSVIDVRLLRQWSAHRLGPLCQRPHSEREKLLRTLGTFLQFSQRSETARALNVQRGTVSGRIKRAGGLLGLDLDDVRDRTQLYLAFECKRRYGLEPAPASVTPPALEDVYAGDAARSWAAARLAPLQDDLRDTLRTWINHGGDYRRAAPHLGLGEAGLRARIARASVALELNLNSSGAYELTAALEITKPSPRSAAQAA